MTDPNNYGVIIEAGALEGCKTIDPTDDDGLYLECARDSYTGAPTHENTEISVNNLFSCLESVPLSINIIGHGENGVIATGSGHSFFDPLKKVAHNNQANWLPHFSRLAGKVKNLYLLGCQTGAGVEGADLVFKLAKIVQAKVAAPTGEIYCTCTTKAFTLENGATWQVADPDTESPKPINPPEPVIIHQMTSLNLFLINRFEVVKPARVSEKMKYQQNGFDGEPHALTRSEYDLLLRSVDFMKPVILPGAPSARRTGYISLVTQAQDKKVTKRFYILNNRMLQDKDFPYIAYYCTKDIKQLFG